MGKSPIFVLQITLKSIAIKKTKNYENPSFICFGHFLHVVFHVL